jgi:hypothetical protein
MRPPRELIHAENTKERNVKKQEENKAQCAQSKTAGYPQSAI